MQKTDKPAIITSGSTRASYPFRHPRIHLNRAASRTLSIFPWYISTDKLTALIFTSKYLADCFETYNGDLKRSNGKARSRYVCKDCDLFLIKFKKLAILKGINSAEIVDRFALFPAHLFNVHTYVHLTAVTRALLVYYPRSPNISPRLHSPCKT